MNANNTKERLFGALIRERSRHGRGTPWIRENRRRRSAGLPQKRVLKFDGSIFDPLDRTVTRMFEDGTMEVIKLR